MARTVKAGQREATNNGRHASETKADGTLNPRRMGRRESSSAGSTNGSSEDRAGEQGQLHQRIAERAYFLYEQSGFQDGNDVAHWLEAERQINAVRRHAA